MLAELLNARVVIADLTGRNPNVFYELGITHSFARPMESLRESLRIVLDADYTPPSPLRDVAANRSVDDLAPENPLAAEMAQIRETLEEVRKNVTPRTYIPPSAREDISVLRSFIEENIKEFDPWSIDKLSEGKVSDGQRKWAQELIAKPGSTKAPKAKNEDPWASDGPGGYSDESPF